MAPKRKGGNPPRKPTDVPKLLISGGIEVLGLKTGPDSITQIECFLNPRMGQEVTNDWYGYSDNVTVSTTFENDAPAKPTLPTYSMSKVTLPLLNDDITSDTIEMWEAISLKTEIVGVNTLTNVHSFSFLPAKGKKKQQETGNSLEKENEEKREGYTNASEGAGVPVQGMNFHFFSVGGEALDLQFIVQNHHTKYPVGVAALDKPDMTAQVLNPKLKAKLLQDGVYPIEAWVADPSKNENTRYYGSYTGGLVTPPVIQITNTLTTILLNENGIGPLCKGDALYLSAADIVGFHTQNNGKMKFRGLPRYFSVTLRKRVVKNPYPVSTLLSSIFTQMQPVIKGQDMQMQTEEVRIYEGTEPLPGDPDISRFRDQFGQEQTDPPTRNRLYPPIITSGTSRTSLRALCEQSPIPGYPHPLDREVQIGASPVVTAALPEGTRTEPNGRELR